ncbi:hypothetical protein UB45_07770 [Terrabacter sp. 28]|nr:hypothetical protein UB45_07770 [Terrabacter sp. 28]
MADDQTGQPAPSIGSMSMEQLIAVSIAGAQAMQGGSSTKVEDMPLIPLWKTRPVSSSQGSGRVAPTGPLAGNVNPIWLKPKPSGAGSSAAADREIGGGADTSYSTMDAAEVHWMEMSQDDRMEFASLAEKAGLWKKSLGPDALAQAWAKSVGWAGKYNHLHQDDQSKWISPFEAATNMAISGLADEDQSHDGFSTESVVQQFNVSQLTSQARQILQSELGRNPTDSEMKAYTAAVNAAARANPQVRTTHQDLGWDGTPNGDSQAVVAGGVDPAEIIQGMAQGTQESADFKTAAMYLPALQQAIGASIHL